MRSFVIALATVAVVAAGVTVAVVFVKTRPVPAKTVVQDRGALVEVIEVGRTQKQVRLPAKGTVIPAQSLALQVEVAGRVIWRHPNLIPGGRFKKGELLMRIDQRDYQIALEQQATSVERAELELELEKGRKVVAEREWELLAVGSTGGAPKPQDPDNTLALRGPQLRTAKAAVHSAKRGVEQAALNLDRTVVRAPWNLIVRDARVDVGQLVTPQQSLGSLVGTDAYWVQVSVPMDWLVWLTGPDGQIEQAPARVWTEAGGASIERQGRVIRLLGDVDPVGRMARLLVEIDDPLGARRESLRTRAGDKGAPAVAAPRLPLLVGTYVNVDIVADDLGEVVEIPDRALREGNNVHLVGADSRLQIRSVKVAFRTAASAYLASGLSPGQKVVLSRLAAPVEGMLLRTAIEAQPRNPGAAPATAEAAP